MVLILLEVSFVLASIAWRSSQSGKARKRKNERASKATVGWQKGKRNASSQMPLKREKSFELAVFRGR